MTQRETLAAIRALGMAASYSAEWGEYRVTFPKAEMPDAERREACASYTDDADDALGTARMMRANADARAIAA